MSRIETPKKWLERPVFTSDVVAAKQGLLKHLQYLISRLVGLAVVIAGLGAIALRAAPIEVVEGEPDVVTDGSHRYSTGRSTELNRLSTDRSDARPLLQSQSAELFVKIQSLEVELRELRGLVEQQAYLIEQLSQRRLDDYLDLDRRIGELQNSRAVNRVESGQAAPNFNAPKTANANQSNGSGTVAVSRSTKSSDETYRSLPAATPVAPVADEAKKAYRDAYQQVKDRQFDQARVALVAFVNDYSESRYTPNAHFWLGELYYLDSNLENARDSYYRLVTEHSNHRKVADAKFKLGKIYHQLGDNDRARLMLQSVLSDHPDSKSANPAREYLKNSLN